MDQADFPWRPLGLLLVEKGIVEAANLETALVQQRRSGRLLGQILVESGYVTSFALAQALAEQHGVTLQRGNSADGSSVDLAPTPDNAEARAWRPLGRILVARGFLTQADLESALAEQEQHPDRRLGEILVGRGSLSGTQLALALAEQHGLDLGPMPEFEASLSTTVKPPAPQGPTYRVFEVAYKPVYSKGSVLYESPNFLEAADFACELVERQNPLALEIEKTDGAARETVWTYSESRAAAAVASRESLVQTFGFDPTRWDTRGELDRA